MHVRQLEMPKRNASYECSCSSPRKQRNCHGDCLGLFSIHQFRTSICVCTQGGLLQQSPSSASRSTTTRLPSTYVTLWWVPLAPGTVTTCYATGHNHERQCLPMYINDIPTRQMLNIVGASLSEVIGCRVYRAAQHAN